MKILVVCQHYYPEPFRITDICEELVKRGNQVTVLTGTPNYPDGKIYCGYKNKSKEHEFLNGVEIYRCFEIPRRKGVLFRVLNYYSFALSSKKFVKKLDKDYDMVFANQLSPVMMAEAAVRYKKLNKKPLVTYVLDLWPASLTAGGIKENSFIYRHYKKVSARIYRAADELLVTSESFKEYFAKEFGFDKEKITCLPQYAESVYSPETCYKIPDDTVDFVFAGNVGKAQSVETLIKAAAMLKNNEKIKFHIVGDGSSLADCKALAADLGTDNVIFYGRKPVSEMPLYYKKADAMIVTMFKNELVAKTLPGKVQSYMAACKPVIAAADGETAQVIKKADCGLVAEAENSSSLADKISGFITFSHEKRNELGENAYKYYVDNFTKEHFFSVLETIFKDIVKK